MRERLVRAVVAVTAAGAAVNGGVFLAFSAVVMPGLDRLATNDPAAAVGAMQAINVAAVRPPLMITLFGTTAAAAGVAALGLRRRRTPAGRLALAGAGVFVAGITALTIAHHVPLNDALASAGGDPAAAWARFAPSWEAGNHVRAAAGIAAAVLLGAAAWSTRADAGDRLRPAAGRSRP